MACPQIKQVLIATGYQHQKIEDFLERYNKKFKHVHLEYNPFFELSDNLMTLWTVRHLFQTSDLIISNGDNLYKNHILKSIIETTQDQPGIFVTINHKKCYDNDDMKVTLNNSGDVLKISKQINIAEANAESVGLVLVRGERARTAFTNAMLRLVKDKKSLQYYWLEVLNELINTGYPVKSIPIENSDWREMDFHPDINLIRESLLKNLF